MIYDKGMKITDTKVTSLLAEAHICKTYNLSLEQVRKLPTKKFLEMSLVAQYVNRVL